MKGKTQGSGPHGEKVLEHRHTPPCTGQHRKGLGNPENDEFWESRPERFREGLLPLLEMERLRPISSDISASRGRARMRESLSASEYQDGRGYKGYGENPVQAQTPSSMAHPEAVADITNQCLNKASDSFSTQDYAQSHQSCNEKKTPSSLI